MSYGLLTSRSEWTDTWFKELRKAQSLVDSYWIKPLSIKDKEKRIKIAILDTGIDLTHPLFQKHLSDGQFPDSRDFVENRQNIIDTCGHGTHTAHLLLKTAPNASIYVARVFRTTKAEKNTASLVANVGHPPFGPKLCKHVLISSRLSTTQS